MKKNRFNKIKASIASLLSAVSFTASNVNAQLDLTTSNCNPGTVENKYHDRDQWVLPKNSSDADAPRVNSLQFHKGYLVADIHAIGRRDLYDLKDLTTSGVPAGNPIKTINLTAGHHTAVGMGEIVAQNWSGKYQLDLGALPSLVSAKQNETEVFVTADKSPERIIYYPYSFGGQPQAYGYQQMGSITIWDEAATFISGDGDSPLHYEPAAVAGGSIETMNKLGFEGRIVMIGNILTIRGDNEMQQGVATWDISDPTNPVFLDSIRHTPDGKAIIKQYDSMANWGGFIILAMNSDTQQTPGVDIIDMRDPSNLKYVTRLMPPTRNTHRYVQIKDNYMFVGEDMYDMTPLLNTPSEAPTLYKSFPNAYGEFHAPVGNLLISASQGKNGWESVQRDDSIRVYCVEATPDTKAPEVAFTWPKNDGVSNVDMHVKSRIGVFIHENWDYSTINANNIYIRNMLTGIPVDVWVSWADMDIINVTPKLPLDDNTSYELYIPAGGIKDVAGNGIEEFILPFSTGSSLGGSNAAPVINTLAPSARVLERNDSVSISVSASDENLDPIEYMVVWGDGSISEWQSSINFYHSYTDYGIYEVYVKVRDNQGGVDSRALMITVEDASLVAHLSSDSVVMGPNNTVWNVNPDNDKVTVINASTMSVMHTQLVGDQPSGIAMDANNNMWVVNSKSGNIHILNGNDATVLHTIQLHPGAGLQATIIDGNYAYVTGRFSNTLYRIDYSDVSNNNYTSINNAYITELNGLEDAYAMAKHGDTLLITRFISAQNQGQVYRVNAKNMSLSNTIALNIDSTSTDTNNQARGLANYLTSIAITADGSEAWVTSNKVNVERGYTRDGLPLTFETSVRSIISVLDLNTNQENFEKQKDMDNRALPTKVEFSDNGLLVYVLHGLNNTASIFRTSDFQALDNIQLGNVPQGLALASDDSLFIHSFLSREVFHVSNDLTLGTFQTIGNPAKTISQTNDALSHQELTGKQAFYNASDARMGRDEYIACASCHLDGGADRRVWDFSDRGEGLRITIPLEGRGNMDHGRVHWSANFDEIQDFEHDMRGPFAGTGFMSENDFNNANTSLGLGKKEGKSTELDAIAAYLGTLNNFKTSPYRNADLSLNQSVNVNGINGNAVNGKTIFNDYACADCHSGTAYTDSTDGFRHDVGTIKTTSGGRVGNGELVGIDTPTLRGVWQYPPYLHDGSAAALSDVFNSAAHAGTDALTAQERADLVAYVLQIDGVEAAAPAGPNPLTITSLTQGQTVHGDVSLSLDNLLLDVSKVEWYIDDSVVATSYNSPFNAVYTPSDEGEVRVYAVATYNGGLNKIVTQELTIILASSAVVSVANSILSSAGTFESNTSEGFLFNGGDKLTFNGEADFTIDNATTNIWDIQLAHQLSITQGTAYTVCFDAKSDEGHRTINVLVDGDLDSGYVARSGEYYDWITNHYQTFKHTFTAPVTDATSRLVFRLGGSNTSDVQLDNIGVYEGEECGGGGASSSGSSSSSSSASNSTSGNSTSSSSSSSSSGAQSEPSPLTCSIGSFQEWGDSFVVNQITVTNTSSQSLSSWLVSLDFTNPFQLTGSWNAETTKENLKVMATGGALLPGGSISFGFQGTYSPGIHFDAPTCTVPGGLNSQVESLVIENPVSILPDNSEIRYTGRVIKSAEAVEYQWANTKIEFKVNAPLIELLFEDGNNDFNVFIDGVLQENMIKTVAGVTKYPIQTGSGDHHILVTKRTSANFGAGKFLGLNIPPGSQMLTLPSAPSRKIEFIGDSWTNGYGNEGESRTCSSLRPNENSYLSFASITARELVAQSHLIALSGYGAVKNYGSTTSTSTDPVPFYYGRTLSSNAETAWDFSSWIPDVVVIKLGTNDYSAAPYPDSNTFKQGIHDLIAQVKSGYGTVPIFLLANSNPDLATAASNIQAVKDEQNAGGNSQVYFLKLDLLPQYQLGCDWHPTVMEHEDMADQLSQAIKTTLDWQ